jgi:receptor-type tyrosine-protein phosphatase O
MQHPIDCNLQCPGPTGEWIEELTEKPQHVSVHVLSSTTALMSWTSSQENYNSTIVSVVSLTCQKQKESQRLEKQYCTQVRSQRTNTPSP